MMFFMAYSAFLLHIKKLELLYFHEKKNQEKKDILKLKETHISSQEKTHKLT